MKKDEEITRNLSLIEYYKEQLNNLNYQSQITQAAILEFQKAKITIDQLKKSDKNSEILIPIGGGTYLNGLLKNESNVLVDVGSGIVIEKDLDSAIKKIDERIKNLQESQEKIVSMAQRIELEATELSEKTQKLVEESK